MGVSAYCSECVVYFCVYVCVYVCVCVISNQSTSKTPHYVSDLSKCYALLHRPYIKVVLPLIQSKKQDVKNSSGGEGWRQQGIGVRQNLKKLG